MLGEQERRSSKEGEHRDWDGSITKKGFLGHLRNRASGRQLPPPPQLQNRKSVLVASLRPLPALKFPPSEMGPTLFLGRWAGLVRAGGGRASWWEKAGRSQREKSAQDVWGGHVHTPSQNEVSWQVDWEGRRG